MSKIKVNLDLASLKEDTSKKGEFILKDNFSLSGNMLSFKTYLNQSLLNLKQNLQNILSLKDKKALISLIIILLIYLLTPILSLIFGNNFLVKLLSSLSFSHGGGVNRSIIGLVVGSIGKVIVASAIFSLIYDHKRIITNAKSIFSNTKVSKNDLSLILVCLGLSLVLVQIVVARASFNDLSLGLASFILICTNLRGGLINYCLKQALAKLKLKSGLNNAVLGLSLGFLLSSVLCILSISYLLVILGVITMIIGVLLKVLKISKKEDPSYE